MCGTENIFSVLRTNIEYWYSVLGTRYLVFGTRYSVQYQFFIFLVPSNEIILTVQHNSIKNTFFLYFTGKTEWIKKLIRFKNDMFDQDINQIIWCYGEEIPNLIAEFKDRVEFHHGITEEIISREKLNGKPTILILDDLQSEVDQKLIAAIFTKYSHHRSISIFFLVQHMYAKTQPMMRLININSRYCKK